MNLALDINMPEERHGDYVFRLPWPPSVNSYWRHVVMGRSARTLISQKGRQYRDRSAGWLLQQRLVNTRLKERLSVHITAYPPDRRARDLDNLPKAALDVLTRAEFWQDDSQIDDLRIQRGHIVKDGLLVVTVNRITTGEKP